MANNQVYLELSERLPLEQQRIELVERKGKGHPDTICDAIAEQVSQALYREYLRCCGRILHHNVDKALLVAGKSDPRLGGGSVLEPMRIVLGDRASARCNDRHIDVGAIAEGATYEWVRQNLRYVEPTKNVVFQNELKPGSPELTDIFERAVVGANDTSAAVGYAPPTETERLVLATERWLNSPHVQQRYPEVGEDVKVMGIRRNRDLSLTVAMAFVDRFVLDAPSYFARKEEIQAALLEFLTAKLETLDRVDVQLNTLDDPARGESGMYLTVLGTSAEGADCGQVGRGNRVNGLIPLNRPVSNEAVAGKNPVSHVGKIYSHLTHHIANQIIRQVDGIAEVYVWLCSQIGRPVDEPVLAAAEVIVKDGVLLPDVEPAVDAICKNELAGIHEFCQRIIHGELSVC
jgi:S-adenosylmethionine synthetase